MTRRAHLTTCLRWTAVIVLSIAAGLVSSGCTNKLPPSTGQVTRLSDAGSTAVTRVDDPERGVTCYVSLGYKSGGISCLPTPRAEVER